MATAGGESGKGVREDPEGLGHSGPSQPTSDFGFCCNSVSLHFGGVNLFICGRIRLFFQDIISLRYNRAENLSEILICSSQCT